MAPPTASTLPPGPPVPGWFQTLAFALARGRFIETSRKRYGDAITFRRLGRPPFVMVLGPELAKQVFHAPPARLGGGQTNASLRPVVGNHSLLLLDGDEHTRQRKLMLPCFQGERLRGYEDLMRDAVDRAIDSWPVGEPFSLHAVLRPLTLEITINAVFGVEGPAAEELRARVQETIDPTVKWTRALLQALSRGRIGSAAAGERGAQSRQRLHELIRETIAERRAAPDLDERGDLLSTLVRARDEDGAPFEDELVRDQLVTLLVAGYQSTQNALAWTFELLLRDPEALAEAKADLEAGDGRYLEAVVSEVLRIRPITLGISRIVLEEPYDLDGHRIPVGSEIYVSIAELLARPEQFPDPHAFCPERFLQEDADSRGWVPFGSGTRRCLGATFAPFEMGVVLRRVLERTQLTPVGDRPEKKAWTGLTLRNGVTFLPKRGVQVVQSRPPHPVPATPSAPAAVAS